MSLPLKDKINTIFKLIFEPSILISLLSLRAWGYLLDMGWFNSFKTGNPIDKSNNPIPWFTYPAVDFLSERLNNSLRVFEFGSGNSTLFFAERVNHIISIEHNKDWFDKISKRAHTNSNIIFAQANNSGQYLDALKAVDHNYDIIVVDGIYRNECCIEAMNFLTDSGVILLDDSEREDYKGGIESLMKKGFKRIDFWGISAGFLYKKATTIFYRNNNSLQI
jgi:hypothetical protein